MLSGSVVGLRAIERDDLAQLLAWRNRPEFRRFFREYRELSMEHQICWYETTVMNDPRTRMFAIVELATGRLLGAAGLCYIDPVNRNADFSIYIGADGLYIDDVFAPDTGRVLLRYGFEELALHRVWAEIYDIDVAKQRLFATLGFTLDGRHREAHWTEGRWVDALFYGLLEPEWRRAAKP
jgi:RimJ/RimL family protein N-acetyltransferase